MISSATIIDGSGENYGSISSRKAEGDAQVSGSLFSFFLGKNFDTGSRSDSLMTMYRERWADGKEHSELQNLSHNFHRDIDEAKVNFIPDMKVIKSHLDLNNGKIEYGDSKMYADNKIDQNNVLQFLLNNNNVLRSDYSINNTSISGNFVKFIRDKSDNEKIYNVDNLYHNYMLSDGHNNINIIFNSDININHHKPINRMNINNDIDKNLYNIFTEISDKGNKIFSMTVMIEEEHPVHIKIEGVNGITNTIILQSENHDIACHLIKNKHDLISTLESAGIDTRHIRVEILEPSATGDKENQRDTQNHDNFLNNGDFLKQQRQQRQQRESRDITNLLVTPSAGGLWWKVQDTEQDLVAYASTRRKGLNITA